MVKISFANHDSLNIIADYEKDNFCGEAYSYDMLNEMLKDNYLLNDNDNILMIADEGDIIGYIIFHITTDFSDIYKIYIRENDRRKKYAKSLIEYVENLAKRYSSKKIMVEVRSQNQAGISFYRALDFKYIDKRLNYYKNPTDDALVLVKEL